MLMKIHSYCATNGEYSVQLKSLESKIKELKQYKVIEMKDDEQQHHKKLVSTLVKNGIYQKLQQFIDQKKEQPTTIDQSLGAKSQSDQGQEKQMNDEMMEQKVHGTIDLLDQLGARNLHDPRDDDDQKEDQYSAQTWPENLTISNFTDYLLIPTLVYRLRYPRTKE
jgi:sterol O-acyltransferase